MSSSGFPKKSLDDLLRDMVNNPIDFNDDEITELPTGLENSNPNAVYSGILKKFVDASTGEVLEDYKGEEK